MTCRFCCDERSITCVAPRLYLGNVHALDNNAAALRARGVQAVVTIAPELSKSCLDYLQRLLGPERHVYLPVSHETFAAKYTQVIQKAVDAIRRFIKEQGVSVFVHCRSGKHRSVAVVVAYLVSEHVNMTHTEAFQHVKALRSCAKWYYVPLAQLLVRPADEIEID